MEATALTATVAVCTFRRHGALARALAGLAAQDDPGVPWDVLVVDGEAAPGASQVVDRIAPSLRVPVRLVRESRAGSAAARNRVIAESRADITVLFDDDVVPEPGCVAALLEPITGGRAEATGGCVRLDPRVTRPAWLDEEGVGGYLARFEPATEERELRPDEFVVTANAAFRTDLLRATGGFDTALGPRPGTPLVNDDVLITRRARWAGGRLRYSPAAVVVHELPAERLRPTYLLRRAHAQGRSDWILDRELLSGRRLGGARVALGWLGAELRARGGEGPWRPGVAFHAACDVARTLGALGEAAALWRAGRT